jgi:hypothetical protein
MLKFKTLKNAQAQIEISDDLEWVRRVNNRILEPKVYCIYIPRCSVQAF